MSAVAKQCFFLTRIYRGVIRRIRYVYFKTILGGLGIGSMILPKAFIEHPYNVFIGKDVNINEYAIIEGSPGGRIEIGDRVHVSYGVTILTASLVLRDGLYVNDHEYKSVIIENDVWIAAKAIILPGVRIGQHAVIAAGAVVARDVEAYTLVAGVPAKLIRRLSSGSE